MTTFDTLALILIGASMAYSIWKGMVREAFSLIALVTAYLIALNYYPDLASFIGDVISEETVANILSFIILFISGLLFVSLVGRIAKKFLHSTHAVSGWDRLLGGIFGLAKGVFLILIVMFPLQWFDETYARWTEDSVMAPYLEEWVDDFRDNVGLSPGFTRSLPGSLRGVRQQIKNLDEIQEGMAEQKENVQDQISDLSIEEIPPQEHYSEQDREQLQKLLKDAAEN